MWEFGTSFGSLFNMSKILKRKEIRKYSEGMKIKIFQYNPTTLFSVALQVLAV